MPKQRRKDRPQNKKKTIESNITRSQNTGEEVVVGIACSVAQTACAQRGAQGYSQGSAKLTFLPLLEVKKYNFRDTRKQNATFRLHDLP